ncbi:MAG: TIGR03617 family F420-dependent LLM class oxidoreductase [Candidatus Binatia bacterium]
MKIDGGLTTFRLADVPAYAREIEALGYDGTFTFEGKSDPFLPLVLAAEHTRRLELATAVALAFPRSPMNLAYLGHDLQIQSQGRFILGLGSQIRTHVEKRYGAAWSHPVARMRELVLAVRAIWRCWNEGERLDFRGRFYTHTLMTPIFDPGPSPWGPPRIFLAGVQPRMTEAAGEVADGLLVHPFHSRRFLDEGLLPLVERGLATAGRGRDRFEVACQVMLATGTTPEEVAENATAVRGQLAFYGSTPAYRPVLEAHGWGPLQEELHALSKQGRWVEMGECITDEMLDTFAVRGTLEELPARLRARYEGRVDRLALVSYAGLERTAREPWMAMLAALRE